MRVPWDSVGQLAANAWGLFDMSGNVSEWVEDSYADSYEGAPIDGSPRDFGEGVERVTRGGSFADSESHTRITARERGYAYAGGGTNGFRIAR